MSWEGTRSTTMLNSFPKQVQSRAPDVFRAGFVAYCERVTQRHVDPVVETRKAGVQRALNRFFEGGDDG